MWKTIGATVLAVTLAMLKQPPEPANPKVAPGLVHWHADIAAATSAARQSGKLVLVFQLLGKLDDQFC